MSIIFIILCEISIILLNKFIKKDFKRYYFNILIKKLEI